MTEIHGIRGPMPGSSTEVSVAVGMSEHAQYLSQSWKAEGFVSTPTFGCARLPRMESLSIPECFFAHLWQ